MSTLMQTVESSRRSSFPGPPRHRGRGPSIESLHDGEGATAHPGGGPAGTRGPCRPTVSWNTFAKRRRTR